MDIHHALSGILQELFGPSTDELARASGFIRQPRKLHGAAFAQALTLAWLGDHQTPLGGLVSALAQAGVPMSCQGLAKRLDARAANFLAALLERSLALLLAGERCPLPILARFAAVLLYDTTVVSLPAQLAPLWPGCGGRLPGNGAAALKISVGWDLLSGGLTHLSLHSGRTHDRDCLPPPEQLAPRTLRVTDLGYFALADLARLSDCGVFWLTRLQTLVRVWYADRWWTQAELLAAHGPRHEGGRRELPVALGRDARVPARLLLERVPPAVAAERRAAITETARAKHQAVSVARLATADFTLLVTNVPSAELTLSEALAVYRCRWQIELLFKQWKSDGGLARSRSAKPQRILCEVYAKLLAQLLCQALVLLGERRTLDTSWRKAAACVRAHAGLLALALAHPACWPAVLDQLRAALSADCRTHRRRGRPATFQRLEGAAARREETG